VVSRRIFDSELLNLDSVCAELSVVVKSSVCSAFSLCRLHSGIAMLGRKKLEFIVVSPQIAIAFSQVSYILAEI